MTPKNRISYVDGPILNGEEVLCCLSPKLQRATYKSFQIGYRNFLWNKGLWSSNLLSVEALLLVIILQSLAVQGCITPYLKVQVEGLPYKG